MNRVFFNPMVPDVDACLYCGWRWSHGARSIQRDHVVPWSRGGKNSPENIVPACASCNATKKDRLPSEWRPDGREDSFPSIVYQIEMAALRFHVEPARSFEFRQNVHERMVAYEKNLVAIANVMCRLIARMESTTSNQNASTDLVSWNDMIDDAHIRTSQWRDLAIELDAEVKDLRSTVETARIVCEVVGQNVGYLVPLSWLDDLSSERLQARLAARGEVSLNDLLTLRELRDIASVGEKRFSLPPRVVHRLLRDR